ncbi:MAG: hypothetical protein IJE00_03595 [Clostridia bacterium]|nr:hypothetical protein [Clostridia bacterium]MBQ2939433.1 hypothetical protein [Clostridia bacterium]
MEISEWRLLFAIIGLYVAAVIVVQLVTRYLYPSHQRVWAVVPLRGRIDNPEALLRSSTVSRLYERGFCSIWFVDSGMDTDSKERCRRLSESGRFPAVLTVEEFSKVLLFLSE